MNSDELLALLELYGLLFLFLVVFLEYLNIPGLPGGLIFLLTGIWVNFDGRVFLLAFAVSLAAGLAGSLLLYLLGRRGGRAALEKFQAAHPKGARKADALIRSLRRHENLAVFLAKLTPVLRTLVGIPAGMAGMDLKNYLFFSGLGIAVWNGGLMLAGMFGSELVLRYLAGL